MTQTACPLEPVWRRVVRALGIEPRSPASETDALSIVLCPQESDWSFEMRREAVECKCERRRTRRGVARVADNCRPVLLCRLVEVAGLGQDVAESLLLIKGRAVAGPGPSVLKALHRGIAPDGYVAMISGIALHRRGAQTERNKDQERAPVGTLEDGE